MSRAARAQLDALLAAQAAEAEAAQAGAALAHDLARAADLPPLPDGYSWARVLGDDLAEPLVAWAYKDGEPFAWTRTAWDNVVRRARDRHLRRLELVGHLDGVAECVRQQPAGHEQQRAEEGQHEQGQVERQHVLQ